MINMYITIINSCNVFGRFMNVSNVNFHGHNDCTKTQNLILDNIESLEVGFEDVDLVWEETKCPYFESSDIRTCRTCEGRRSYLALTNRSYNQKLQRR